MNKTTKNRGQTLIELLIGIAVFGLLSGPFLSSVLNLTASQVRYRYKIQAVQYAREGMELVYNIIVNLEKDQWPDMLALASSNPYYPSETGPISLQPGTQTLNGGKFERSIYLTQNGNNLDASCQIDWRFRGKDENVELKTTFIDLSQFGGPTVIPPGGPTSTPGWWPPFTPGGPTSTPGWWPPFTPGGPTSTPGWWPPFTPGGPTSTPRDWPTIPTRKPTSTPAGPTPTLREWPTFPPISPTSTPRDWPTSTPREPTPTTEPPTSTPTEIPS